MSSHRCRPIAHVAPQDGRDAVWTQDALGEGSAAHDKRPRVNEGLRDHLTQLTDLDVDAQHQRSVGGSRDEPGEVAAQRDLVHGPAPFVTGAVGVGAPWP